VGPGDSGYPRLAQTIPFRLSGEPAASAAELADVLRAILREMDGRPLAQSSEAGAVEAARIVRFRLLGGFSASAGTVTEERWGARSRRLVLFLLLNPARVTRERLIETFWPDSTPVRGDGNLRVALHESRRNLSRLLPSAADPFLAIDGTLELNPVYSRVTDLGEYEDALERARASSEGPDEADLLAEAVRLYRGDLAEEDAYEEWLVPRREQAAAEYVWALRRLAALAERRGDWSETIWAGAKLAQRTESLAEGLALVRKAGGRLLD
jgi:DNA-binding SARP family transcriptional activator